MNPELTPEQQLLREASERFIEDTLPLSRVREMIEKGSRPDASYRAQAGNLGWYACFAPDSMGGGSVSGAALADAAILAELHGRHLQPLNFIDTNVVVATVARHGTAEQQDTVLQALITGEESAAWAVAGPSGDWCPASGVEAQSEKGGYVLRGSKGMVVEAQAAEWFLVSASTSEGLAQLLVPAVAAGVRVEPLAGLDLTRTMCRVHFDDVRVGTSALLGAPGEAADAIDEQLRIASVLCIAGSAGAMEYLFNLTLEYCKDRIAFGRPIGSFQAVKHQLADSSLAVEMSHAVVTGAAKAADSSASTAELQASMAKAFVAEAGVQVSHNCWQNFGGISYTWDHDFHLFLRRLTVDAALYGSATWHRENICALGGL